MDDEWLTTNQAAELTNYHPESIRRLARSGKIEAKLFGNSLAIKRTSLLAYLETALNSDDPRSGPKKRQKSG